MLQQQLLIIALLNVLKLLLMQEIILFLFLLIDNIRATNDASLELLKRALRVLALLLMLENIAL